jgi:hypothetical protein
MVNILPPQNTTIIINIIINKVQRIKKKNHEVDMFLARKADPSGYLVVLIARIR